MTDMIAGEDVPGSNRNFAKVNNLRPADQEEDPSNQPAAEMREHSLRNVLSEHVSIKKSEVQEFRSNTGFESTANRVEFFIV